MAWYKMVNKLEQARREVERFRIFFMDEKRFKKFFDSILDRPHHDSPDLFVQRQNIDVAGYFSEGAVDSLCSLTKISRVRLISPELDAKRRQDKRNLRALWKMQDAGIDIKIHKRLHARFLISYNESPGGRHGRLLLGSFDFNKEGILGERRDIGILTEHPDLIDAAKEYFQRIWDEEYESIQLDEEYPR